MALAVFLNPPSQPVNLLELGASHAAEAATTHSSVELSVIMTVPHFTLPVKGRQGARGEVGNADCC